MKKWIKTLIEHGKEIEILSSNRVLIKNAYLDTITGEMIDDTLERDSDGTYQDSEGNEFRSIYDYLGY